MSETTRGSQPLVKLATARGNKQSIVVLNGSWELASARGSQQFVGIGNRSWIATTRGNE